MITDDQIKALNPNTVAGWIVGTGAPLSKAQFQTLLIACRNGGYVQAGTGEHHGHVERVSASALSALVRRGYLTRCYGSEGVVAGRLSENVRTKLTDALEGQAAAKAAIEGTLALEAPPEAPPKARQGAWTPWAAVLCVECEHDDLKSSTRGAFYPRRVKFVSALSRTEEIEQPKGDELGTCTSCMCKCWVRDDVALLQQVGLKASDLDWEGPFTWSLQQTGGMCAALVFETEGRQIVVTAMDSSFYVGEYAHTEGEEESWDSPLRTWESASLYEDDAMKSVPALTVMVGECASKAIEFIRNPVSKGTDA